jgi:hypothetical protein
MRRGASTSCELVGSPPSPPIRFHTRLLDAAVRFYSFLLSRTADVTIHQSYTVEGAFLVRYGERADFCGGVRLVNTVSGSPAYIDEERSL